MEKKYKGIVSQRSGSNVVANPTLDGSEQALNSIQINGENFKIAGGAGGSGKLKLVATGTYEQEDDGELANISLDKALELNKVYVIVINDYDNLAQNFITIFSTQIDEDYPYGLSFALNFQDFNTDTLFVCQAGMDIRYMNKFYLERINGDIDNCFSYYDYSIKVYELELGGSSGGSGRKESSRVNQNIEVSVLDFGPEDYQIYADMSISLPEKNLNEYEFFDLGNYINNMETEPKWQSIKEILIDLPYAKNYKLYIALNSGIYSTINSARLPNLQRILINSIPSPMVINNFEQHYSFIDFMGINVKDRMNEICLINPWVDIIVEYDEFGKVTIDFIYEQEL